MNLKWLFEPKDDFNQPIYESMASLRNSNRLRSHGPSGKIVLLNKSQVRGMLRVIRSASYVQRIQTTSLQNALQSGEFLVYDRTSQGPRSGPIQTAMYKLLLSISRCQRLVEHYRADPIMNVYQMESWSRLEVLTKSIRHAFQMGFLAIFNSLSRGRYSTIGLLVKYGRLHPVFARALTNALRLGDELENIVNLSIALLRYIEVPTSGIILPDLNPLQPYEDKQLALEYNDPRNADIDDWIATLLQNSSS